MSEDAPRITFQLHDGDDALGCWVDIPVTVAVVCGLVGIYSNQEALIEMRPDNAVLLARALLKAVGVQE